MRDIDSNTFFTALAFVAVMGKPHAATNDESAEKIRNLARLIEAFCAQNVTTPLPDDADALEVDQMIARYIEELREKEETRLPEDRESLIKLHDRLNYRNLRRLNRELYPRFSTSKLADLVLGYLDEEIEQSGSGGLR